MHVQTTLFLSTAITYCTVDQHFANRASYEAELPRWLYDILVMIDHMCEVLTNSGSSRAYATCSDPYASELQNVFSEQMTDVYRGITCHAEAFANNVKNAKLKSVLMHRAEKHFHKSAAMHQNQLSIFTNVAISDGIFHQIYSLFILRESHVSGSRVAKAATVNSDSDAMKTAGVEASARRSKIKLVSKLLLYSRSTEQLQCVRPSRISHGYQTQHGHESLRVSRSLKGSSLSRVDVFDWFPGRSPTVSVSWFIAKAYLANLYYAKATTTQSQKYATRKFKSIRNHW